VTEIPTAWLWVSGVCFALSALLNVGLIIGGIIAWGKIGPLVSELQKQVKQLGDKGNQIADKAKTTVDIMHNRAESILGSAEDASGRVAQKIGAASAALTGAFVLLRVLAFARGMATPKKKDVTLKRIKA